jgi:FkbM family methyltransferase
MARRQNVRGKVIMFAREVEVKFPTWGQGMHPETRLSFSQFGEDLIIWTLLQARKRLDDGFYIDVGAFDPFRYSNTALLHLFRGWRGVNIDANPNTIDLFRQHRPNDINIQAAISDVECETEFFVFNHGAVNTLDPVMAASYADKAGNPFVIKEKLVTRTRRLDDILGSLTEIPEQIGLLSVDCEGLDHRILSSMDWNRFSPLVVAAECHGMDLNNPSSNPTHCLLTENGYRLMSHVYVTSIYIKK